MSEDEYNDTVADLRVLTKAVESVINNGKKRAISKRDVGFYQSTITRLQNAWEEYKRMYRSLRKFKIDSEIKTLLEKGFEDLDLKCAEYQADLFEGLNKKQEQTTPGTQQATTASTNTHVTNIQLPRITLPKFDGNYDNWRAFRDLFKSVVHDDKSLHNVQKLHYLKGCLTNEAERLLRNVPITNDDYEPAWEKLKKRYENPRILINTQVKRLLNQEKLKTESSKGLRSLTDTTEECLQQISLLGEEVVSWGTLLIHILEKKLPIETIKVWEEDIGDSDELPTLDQFIKFLQTRARILECVTSTVGGTTSTTNNTTKCMHTSNANSNQKCPACSREHYVATCEKFRNMDINERKQCIAKARLCFNCFSSKHQASKCTSKYTCKKCHKKHNTWLHPESNINHGNSSAANNNDESTSSGSAQSQNFFVEPHSDALLATALVTVKNHYGESGTLRCLVDPGSQASFISERAVRKLGLQKTPAHLEVKGLNGNQTAWITSQVQTQLQSCIYDDQAIEATLFVIKGIAESLPTQTLKHQTNWYYLTGLKLADPCYWKAGPVDILLGAGLYSQILLEGLVKGMNGGPTAIHTAFGWVLLGGANVYNEVQTFATYKDTVQDINVSIQKFWESEEVDYTPRLSPEDQQCEDHFQRTHTRLENGQYQVRLPFKQAPNVGRTRDTAFRQYQALERRFARDNELKKTYTQCIEEYIELGHMVESSNPADGYHLPHHPVFKDSTTTKVRVVFNGGALSDIKESLNGQLLTGPRLQPKLFSTLLKWRRYKVAITGDIEKMYRMIQLHPEDRRYQQIIWKDSKTNKIRDYELTTVTFGTSSAPYLAIKTLQQLANDERQRFPLAAKAALEDFYVDDLLTGADDIQTAVLIRDECIHMLKEGHFNLRKWSSNCLELLRTLPPEDVEINKFLQFNEPESVKTLGIRWTPKTDTFSFVVRTQAQSSDLITKRNVLSKIASLYDPLGWISPFVIQAKVIMQEVWVSGCKWDQEVNDPIKKKWKEFVGQLEEIEQIKIPRWIGFTTRVKNIQLHGFSDASIKAYAAVIYFVAEVNGLRTSTLLTAKTKVAPIKPVTIPRLELCGAQLLSRLMKHTIADMGLHHARVISWTDSTIVLHWIKSHARKWKTYVQNRVADIQDRITPECWKHVPTDQNPADLASRGIDVATLNGTTLWWNGPKWLTQSEQAWPNTDISTQDMELEAKVNPVFTFINKSDESLFHRYSSSIRLIRVVASMFRFLHNSRHKLNKINGDLTIDELERSKNTIWRVIQRNHFLDEYTKLKDEKELSSKSKILPLYPFLDGAQVIRVGGRLQKASISYGQKHPVILPTDHHVTNVLIRETHLKTLHGGTTLVLNTLRQEYWIVNGKRAVSAIINRCPVCVRYRQQTRSQIMGNLPADRINVNQAFENVGIDYAGPVYIKSSSLRNAKTLKAYFCIFVCMATKAIHLEAVSDMTTEAFVATLRRFVARRGLCKTIYSDCGSNFKGAKGFLDKELKEAIKTATLHASNYSLTHWSLTWKFNPPGSPHFGALWEANVKSVKHHLLRTIGVQKLTFEELTTLLAQIEAILNSRPLCSIENSIDDLEVLTPGHFLIGRPLNSIPQPELDPEANIYKRWRYVQVLTQEFWKKWVSDYLNTLQHRPKWRKSCPNIKVGEVVIIKDELRSPTYWPLGRVIKVSPGNDDKVRVVTVKTATAEFDRSITKVCVIPSQE